MPFSTTPDQCRYFQDNKHILFDNLVTLDQKKLLIDSFNKEAPITSHSLSNGFELWRKAPLLKSLICSKKLALVLGQLKNILSLRYGYSQLLGARSFCNDTALLAGKSFIKNLIGGVCICLKPASDNESPFFPTEPLSALFFDIDEDFLLRFPKTDGMFLFIFYADIKARFYRLETKNELYNNFLDLNMNYSHGDFLSDSFNPSFTVSSL